MTRKVVVHVKVKLILDMEDGVEVGDFLSEMDYGFYPADNLVSVVDTEILDHEVVDSK